MSVPFFKDIGKTVSDLFKKGDYDLQRTVKVTIEDGGNSVETKVKDSGSKLKTTVKFASGSTISKQFGGRFSVKADTSDNYEVEVKKLKFGGVKTDSKLDTAKTSLTFKNKFSDATYNANADIGYNYDNQNVSVDAGFVFGKEGVSVGGSAKSTFSEGNFGDVDYNVGIEWNQGSSNYSLKTGKQIGNVTLAAFKNFGNDTVAVSLYHDIESGNSSAAVGGSWGLDDKSSVQGFLESGGQLRALYNYKLSSRVGFKFGAQTSLSDLASFQNVGYQLSFK